MSGILLASVGNSYGAAPVNTVAPAVTGTATVGQTLSTTDGTWTGAPAPTFAYQWQRSAVNIGGATSSTYVLVAADYANTIRCVVTATNTLAPSGVSANSNSTASVAGNAPANTVAPAVTGTATVGQTLSSTTGTWTGVPTPTFTFQWQRSASNIGGATSSTYVLVDADAANTIRCVVTATNAVSAVSANSNSTASVAATVPGAPTIGTATQTGATTATVVFTQPSSNGGATITSYTATSSPGGGTGTLSQAGSGTINVTGLSGGTSYTFTVTATNSAGTSAASGASNSITTPLAIGQALGGGFYAGQISTSANGVATHNLIVSNTVTGQAYGQAWGIYGNTTGAVSPINGAANTTILAGLGAAYVAATFCENLSSGGFTDWYLPAPKELNTIYYFLKPGTQLNALGYGANIYAVLPQPINTNNTAVDPAQTSATNFRTGASSQEFLLTGGYSGAYWTSSDNGSALGADCGGFVDGQPIGLPKNYPLVFTRAIRKVAV